ncbi:MAG: helix-turn-helix transcriptional regulator [Nitrospirae bacterium]|nr:helix-turn-helix transcriptional regulator [Nitrospirota bacterium]
MSRCHSIPSVKVKSYKNVVGENLRKIRQGRGLTQEELALMSGLSQGYINQLESGKRRFTQKTLTAIAEALGLPLLTFFREEGQGNLKVAEQPASSARRPAAREVIRIFKALPPQVADHYLTLMTIEKDLQEKKKGR